MVYARVHNRTVAQDYFSAMAQVEQRLVLDLGPGQQSEILDWLDQLQAEPLTEGQQAAVQGLRAFILALGQTAISGIPLELPLSVA